MPRKPRVSEMIASARVEPVLDHRDQAFGHSRLELQADDPAAPPPLDRGAEVADQVLGFLLDLDVAVADDPEGAAAQHLIFREQIIRSCGGSGSPARCSGRRRPGCGRTAASVGGAMISSRTLALPFFSSKMRLRPLLGMNGKGCAGSIACGVRIGKICSRKCWSSQASASSSSGSSPTTCMPAPSSCAWSSAQTSCWLVTSRSASAVIAGELLGDGQAVGREFLDPERLVRLQARDPDHEEFVEIVGRDGQEADPFEQRMLRVARFLEHAAVEREPAQLAIEVARFGLRRLRGSRTGIGQLRNAVHQIAVACRDAGFLIQIMSPR